MRVQGVITASGHEIAGCGRAGYLSLSLLLLRLRERLRSACLLLLTLRLHRKRSYVIQWSPSLV